MSSGMPITQYRPKIETGSQPTDPFEAIPRIYLSYITSDTSSKASDSTIANTPVARLPKNSSTQRIRHSKPESCSTSVIAMLQQCGEHQENRRVRQHRLWPDSRRRLS